MAAGEAAHPMDSERLYDLDAVLAEAGIDPNSLDEQFAAFADEALEWAQHSAGAVSESWPE